MRPENAPKSFGTFEKRAPGEYSVLNKRHHLEAMGNKLKQNPYIYSLEPRDDAFCLGLNLNILKLVYWQLCSEKGPQGAFPQEESGGLLQKFGNAIPSIQAIKKTMIFICYL